MTSNKTTIIWLIIAILLIVIVLLIFSRPVSAPLVSTTSSSTEIVSSSAPEETGNSTALIHATFVCPGGEVINAVFHNEENSFVDLALPDGRLLRVPQALSADGARYATENEMFVFWNKGNEAFIEENGTTTLTDCIASEEPITTTTPDVATVANPASLYCQEKGGQLEIALRPDNSQYGLCYFDDNRACEEWAMFRGDCPIGGVKTTGYNTGAQKFCAWSGGHTLAVPDAVCTFDDGSSCLADDFYTGACQKGNNN